VQNEENAMQVTVPPLGQGLQEAIVVSVNVAKGEPVREGDIVASIESDKAVHDVQSSLSGCVLDVHAQPGDRLCIGAPIMTIGNPLNLNPTHRGNDAVEIGYRIREYSPNDFGDALSIWVKNQELASSNLPQFDAAHEDGLRNCFESAKPPFGAWIAEDGSTNRIEGWAALLPYKNSPISRELTAEVSLYVQDPSAISTPATLLLTQAIKQAEFRGMSFLLGFTSRSNEWSQKLLDGVGFRCVAEAGKHSTNIWVYDCK